MPSNPYNNPTVSQPSVFRPTVVVEGNRETSQTLHGWLQLLQLPNTPLDTFNTCLQWLFVSQVATQVALVAPLWLQISLMMPWLFLAFMMSYLVNKVPQIIPDVLVITVSVVLGVCLVIL